MGSLTLKSAIFKIVFEKRKEFSAQTLVDERKKNAYKISAEGLSSLYNYMINPEKIALAEKVSHLDADGTFFMSKKLAKKYETFGFGIVHNIEDTYQETSYPEEKSLVFQALEKTAVESQRIWLKKYIENKKFIMIQSKWMKKLLARAEKAGVTRLPRFIYKTFSLYCKVKTIFKRGK